MKKNIIRILLIMFAIFFAANLPMHGQDEVQLRLMIRIDTYADGSSKVRYFFLDPQTQEYEPLTMAGIETVLPAAFKFQSGVFTRSWHWNKITKIKFGMSPDAKPHKKEFKRLQNRYHNKRRGNANVPKFKITTQIVKIIPFEEWDNKALFYTQFDWDDNNTIVMTDDDQFFEDIFGNLFDPEIVGTTRIFGFITIRQEGGRFVGTIWIVEADCYFRSDFFTLAKLTYKIIATGIFKFVLGYQTTSWAHDFMSAKQHYVERDFRIVTSDTWVKISFIRDDFYYMDMLGALSYADYLSTPKMLPHEGEVIDIGEYELPFVDEHGDIVLNKTPILFLTNLKAFAGKKKTLIKIYRIVEDDPPKRVLITKLKGNTLFYPQNFSGTEVYASIFLNHVRIGKQVDLNKLKDAVRNHGEPQTIDGVDFEKAIKIRVAIKGRLTENGPKKTLVRTFWLVDTEDSNDIFL